MTPVFDANGNEIPDEDVIKNLGLREKLAERNDLERQLNEERAKIAEMQRSDALLAAGVSRERLGLFTKAFEGEATPEAVAKFATDNGITLVAPASAPAPTGTAPTGGATNEDVLAQMRQQEGSVGQSTPTGEVDLIAQLDAAGKLSPDEGVARILEITQSARKQGLLVTEPGVYLE